MLQSTQVVVLIAIVAIRNASSACTIVLLVVVFSLRYDSCIEILVRLVVVLVLAVVVIVALPILSFVLCRRPAIIFYLNFCHVYFFVQPGETIPDT